MKNRKKNKIKLSVQKIETFLSNNNYAISAVYIDGDNYIKFIECITPKYQKTFLLYIPDKYVLKSNRKYEEKFKIKSSKYQPDQKQIKFMTEMKGMTLDCDIVVISGNNISLYKDNNENDYYDIFSDDMDNEENTSEEEENQITKLEKNALKLINKINPENKIDLKLNRKNKNFEEISDKEEEIEDEILEDEEEVYEEHEFENEDELLKEEEELLKEEEELLKEEEELLKEEEEEVLIKEEILPEKEEEEVLIKEEILPEEEEELDEDEELIELIFEDEEGNEIDSDKSLIIEDMENTLKKLEDRAFKNDYETIDNKIPENFNDLDFFIGVIYVVIDIGSFFKGIEKYETQILDCYNHIDDNEKELNKKRMKTIKEISEKVVTNMEEKINEISQKRENLKIQLIRLTLILNQTDKIKTRLESDSKSNEGIKKELDIIYNKTQKTINDLNIENLRLREDTEEILLDYKNTLSDLLTI